jgi:predicted HNH restriction endonuclease
MIVTKATGSKLGFLEGALHPKAVNAYERNRDAREACLRHHGVDCAVCGFNFQRRYGAKVANFIHVHQVRPVAGVEKEYTLDPIADLRPVCPNCHTVIHLIEPHDSTDEVRAMLASIEPA